jgi:hypothetical protein
MPSTLDLRLERNWTIYLVHHSHTDIGYTQLQGRVARFHVDFLDQVIAISKRIEAGDKSLAGFTWTNECFWSIEQWLAKYGTERLDELLACVRNGTLGLTGTYLHFTELIDEALLRAATQRPVDFAKQHGLALDTALSADINGFSWGYSQVLHDAGIRNLITCVHSHHGLAPFAKRQFPFFWQTPAGQEILVWNGEHYNLGNVLGLAPGAALTYGFQDELKPPMRLEETYPLASTRLPRYLKQLEIDGYPQDFVLLQAGGTMSDNAPPSAAIARFVNEWNALHGESIRIEMTTPSAFCGHVRERFTDIPRHHGDWPDWWSDGFASTPSDVRLAREAMRLGRWTKELSAKENLSLPTSDSARLEQNLLLFTEHTFNHSDSMAMPWSTIAKGISGIKKSMAATAYEAAMELQDEALARLGEYPNQGPEPGERFVFKVINPLSEPVSDFASLYLEKRDFGLLQLDPRVTDVATGAPVPCDKIDAPRGYTFDVHLDLGPGEETFLELTCGTGAIRSLARNFTEETAQDDVLGQETADEIGCDASAIETAHLRIEFSAEGHITALRDKQSGHDLLAANRRHAPFVPVYEVTPVPDRSGPNMADVRRSFGRNRKGADVQRYAGTVADLRLPGTRNHFIPVEIDYALEGTEWVRVQLKIWRNLPRIDATVTLQKKCIWEPENLYLALPFSLPESQLWLDKPGGPIRPWQDQLPDTLTDWYCLQEGYGICGKDLGIAVATPDSPLLQLGPLEHGKRSVMGHPALRPENARPYAWLMTNYWETNFEANLGGFHEFRYRIEFGAHLADPKAAIRRCHTLNQGFKPFRVKAEG